MMADLPILFSAPMVRALLREIERPGTGKTQTRRVLTADCDEPPALVHDGAIIAYDDGDRSYRWPNTKAVGDRLYVREAWRCEARLDQRAPREIATNYPGIKYIATAEPDDFGIEGKFRQAMHMPRWASRITLIVTDVRVQRLSELSEADAIAEGIERNPHGNGDQWLNYPAGSSAAGWMDPRKSFRTLWDSINDARGYGWAANPWVAAYTFRPILGNIDQIAEAA